MAFGGVDTGSMKPSDEESAMPTATGIGLKPAAMAAVTPKGPIMFVAAVCDESSDRRSAMTEKIATIMKSDGSPPIQPTMQSPTHVERPVLYIMPPIARPPPKRISVPHSMPAAASFQFSVNSRSFQLTGRKKSRRAPAIAAIASGKSLPYILRIGESGPRTMFKMPGVTQRMTATQKPTSVFFCARVQPPRARRFSAMNASAPSMRLTSAGNMLTRMKYAMMK